MIAFLFVGCVAIVSTGDVAPTGGDTNEAQPAQGPGDSQAQQGDTRSSRIGQAVRDGTFTFTVTETRRSPTFGESEILRQEAQGEFAIFDLTVKNHGDKPQLFDASSQKLFVGDKEYSAEVGLEGDAFLNEINPGNSVDGQIAFDVPEDVKPTRLELHDSMFSEGVSVSLK